MLARRHEGTKNSDWLRRVESFPGSATLRVFVPSCEAHQSVKIRFEPAETGDAPSSEKLWCSHEATKAQRIQIGSGAWRAFQDQPPFVSLCLRARPINRSKSASNRRKPVTHHRPKTLVLARRHEGTKNSDWLRRVESFPRLVALRVFVPSCEAHQSVKIRFEPAETGGAPSSEKLWCSHEDTKAQRIQIGSGAWRAFHD